METTSAFDWYVWVILPLMVFFARLVDVSLGTIRIIFTSRGKKHLAPLLGFVEVLIWISIIAQITKGAHNIVAYLAYAGGFAAGNYVGMFIEDKLALGWLVVRAILPENKTGLMDTLRAAGYGVTSVNGQGAKGPVKLVYTIVSRKDLPRVIETIHRTYPKTFFTVEELRSVEQGVFPTRTTVRQDMFFGRKSK
jgi:uncharacterized protein YebE (UPF0316 family)